MPHTLIRWIWSPVEQHPDIHGHNFPTCRQYAYSWEMPADFNGTNALVRCEMTPAQLEAAQQDNTIIVLKGVRSQRPIPDAVASALAAQGITQGMTLYDALEALMEKTGHHLFDPEKG